LECGDSSPLFFAAPKEKNRSGDESPHSEAPAAVFAMPPRNSDAGSSGRFATTHWSLIARAQDAAAPEARAALSSLCQLYWYPLYAFIRRRGAAVAEAQDLTQEFFARLLEKDFLANVEPGKGRFRSFLLAACKHFLANERDRARAQKRGGGRAPVSLDLHNAEDRYLLEPAHDLTAEKLFERRWALTLLDQVLARLRAEYEQAGKSALFEGLKNSLAAGEAATPYAKLAGQLNMSEGAVKVAAHRLRRRYRQLLREEIARTVPDPANVDEEIRDLFQALGAGS
jgi:RNA polymerase sigma-70 factor (ECF subfamily)